VRIGSGGGGVAQAMVRGGGVVTIRAHPHLDRLLQRTAAAGELVAVLPGVDVWRERGTDLDVRICRRSVVFRWCADRAGQPRAGGWRFCCTGSSRASTGLRPGECRESTSLCSIRASEARFAVCRVDSRHSSCPQGVWIGGGRVGRLRRWDGSEGDRRGDRAGSRGDGGPRRPSELHPDDPDLRGAQLEAIGLLQVVAPPDHPDRPSTRTSSGCCSGWRRAAGVLLHRLIGASTGLRPGECRESTSLRSIRASGARFAVCRVDSRHSSCPQGVWIGGGRVGRLRRCGRVGGRSPRRSSGVEG
jgi:hypothetical protein